MPSNHIKSQFLKAVYYTVEKHNFNPHEVRGDFDFDRNGKARVLKTAGGAGDG